MEKDLTVEISQKDEIDEDFTAVSLVFDVAANSTKRVEVPEGNRIVRWAKCTLGACAIVSANITNFVRCERYVESSGNTSLSDYRYKKNINSLSHSALTEKLMQLNPKSYEYDFVKFPGINAVRSNTYGFIAQDLEKVFPETVIRNEEGYRSVNYTYPLHQPHHFFFNKAG